MPVHIEDRDHLRIVTLDRPERRNALDGEMFVAIGGAFASALDDDDIRVIVLTATGTQAFCVGMDLKAFSSGQGNAGSSPTAPTAPTAPTGPGPDIFTERFYPKPIVVAVNGDAVGGGFGLALGGDVIVAAEHARFGLPEVKRGLVGAGVSSRVSLRLPPVIALEMGLTGELVSAGRAAELGLVNRVVPGEQVLEVALELASTIASNGPLAVRVTKGIIHDVLGLQSRIDMPALRAKAAPVIQSADAKEGAQAFLEKRPPRWTGR